MVTFEAALEIVMRKTLKPGLEKVPLGSALGRIVAQDIVSDVDLPPADLSAMDGFACRAADILGPMRVIETIAAGMVPRKKIGAGTCARIMTGARIPAGADLVVMFEHAKEKNGLVTVIAGAGKKTNIRLRAEDVTKGDVVVTKGSVITPAVVGVLASAGCPSPKVFRRVKVGVITTGDELVEPSHKPPAGKIRNSNGWQLMAQVQSAGCDPVYFGIIKDTFPALERVVKKALGECDVVLLSGGVSMGDFDYVPDVLEKIGVRIVFDTIAVKPGKPTVFGAIGRKRLFGMPGNPVSSFVMFEKLVRPFLYKMSGRLTGPLTFACPFAAGVERKNASRLEFRPASISDQGTMALPEYHSSAHIHAYTHAHGIVALPAGVARMGKGAIGTITLLDT